MKKLFLTAMTVAISVVFSIGIFGCLETAQDFRGAERKPDIREIMSDYHGCSDKKGELEAEIVISVYQAESAAKSATQKIFVTRIFNCGKIYVDASARLCDVDDALKTQYLLTAKNFAKKFAENESGDGNDKFGRYLGEKPTLAACIGYADGCYNLKLTTGGKNAFWGAADETNLTGLIAEYFPDFQRPFKDILIANGDLDGAGIADFFQKDESDDYFLPEKNSFEYKMKILPEKIPSLVFTALCGMFNASKNESLSEIPSAIRDRITVNSDSFCRVSANYDGLPEKLESDVEIDVNIPIDKILEGIISSVSGKTEKEISDMLDFFCDAIKPCGTNGEEKTVGIRIKLTSSETFSYGGITLSSVDEELFLPLSEKNSEREILPALT